MSDIIFNGETLTTKQVQQIAYEQFTTKICENALLKNRKSRDKLNEIATQNYPIYGVTTGFGEMVYKFVGKEHESLLQKNLVLSHAAGVGALFDKAECRAILAARINALAKGYSAVTDELLARLILFLNKDIIPAIPQIGSLGASGDLGPLAHIAVTVIGQGYVYQGTKVVATAEVLQEHNIPVLELKFKEGLALINGTSAMTGLGSLLCEDAENQIRQAEIIAALALENQRASTSPFLEQGHDIARPHPGQIDTAKNMRSLLKGSALTVTHDYLCQKMKNSADEVYIQKAYTLRCIPQIIGAVRAAQYHAHEVITRELNSANDNPLFFDDLIFHGGNFHGQPIAFVMDYLAIGLTQLGITSERRTNRLLNRHLSNGLPDFLVKGTEPGLSCGFAGAQYPATALIAENRTLCTPASIQSVPSNGDNQDVVSMGLIAGRKAKNILNNNYYILAIELMSAAQAVDIAKQQALLGECSKITYDFTRSIVPTIDEDQYMSDHIEKLAAGLKKGLLHDAINKRVQLI